MTNYLNRHGVRHGVSTFLAVIFAGGFNYFFSFSGEPWAVVTAWLVCQTTRGAAMKQSVKYLFVVMLIAAIWPAPQEGLMQARMLDVLIGGVIGILFNQWVLPVRPDWEFKQGVLPVLRALIGYQEALIANNAAVLIERKWKIEAALQERQGMYPEWAYEVGFNRGLRAGFRFFLIHVERVCEIAFSLYYWTNNGVNVVEELPAMQDVVQGNVDLLKVLVVYFSENKLPDISNNFTQDMVELEQALQAKIPPGLDLLALSPDYLTLTGTVRALKDMRELLLQLAMTLQETVK